MAEGKQRGIVYSLITLLLVVPLLLYMISYLDSAGSRDELISLKIRGIEISNFANSVSQDVPRIFRITSKRALISAINEIDINGTPLLDAQANIVELMLNSSINNKSSPFMNASSLKEWASRMENQSNNYGFKTNITFLYVNVTPYDSFNLEFSMRLFVNSTDYDGIVSIVRTYNETFILSLEGMEDVLYPLNTGGFVRRLIRKANFTVFGASAVDDAITLERYTSTQEGGSFLDRMEGKNYLQKKYADQSSLQIGLESFVNLQEIASRGLPIKENQTNIDHLYFNSSTFNGCLVTASNYSWLKLDYPHNETYGVETAPC